MSDTESQSIGRFSPEGHAFSEVDWLDAHFTWMEPEYEDMLRWVELKPGWRVLDAASGPGSFLSLMSELIGATGSIDAIDLASENIAVLKGRSAVENWKSPVTARVGSITDLPYDDGSFDAVWCANTRQYLRDDQLRKTLSEFRRVVRPGGLIAVKDYDVSLQQIHPSGPLFTANFQKELYHDVRSQYRDYYHQLFRVIDLARWMRAAGIVEIRQRPTFILRQQPINEVGKSFMSEFFKFVGVAIEGLDVSESDRAIWNKLLDFESKDHPFNDPDFQYRCIQTVFVGTNPS